MPSAGGEAAALPLQLNRPPTGKKKKNNPPLPLTDEDIYSVFLITRIRGTFARSSWAGTKVTYFKRVA